VIFRLSLIMEKVESLYCYYRGRLISKDLMDTLGRFSDILNKVGTSKECSLSPSEFCPPRVDFIISDEEALSLAEPPWLISLETLIFRP